MALNHDDTAIERWADPPPSARGAYMRDGYKPIVDTLRRRPRTWALVFEGAPNTRTLALRKASPQIEAVSRNTRSIDGKTRVDVYARYIPKAVEAVS